ncbi:hypothetical protein BS50DRAFT_680871 [Corynespora cassiicola Philippines]|uniref:Ent-kaurene synthase n=1 Tax=Corynespora cassiicola Philippines TaxID=1448308 RepID=A0A2T2N7Q5_CORCC|nr:hypothetical protein BS50DRAFT_680871 [Corynespora cassiicola Philippines]
MDQEDIEARAKKLHERVLGGGPECYPVSTFDTALAASLRKSLDHSESITDGFNGDILLFPKAFTWLLSRQQGHGGWDVGVESFDLDCILNAMAGLLALVKFRKGAISSSSIPFRSLDARIAKARQYLDERLKEWDPEADVRRAAISLVKRLASLLKKEDVELPFLKKSILNQVTLHAPLQNGNVSNKRKFDTATPLSSRQPCIGGNELVKAESEKDSSGVDSSPALTALHILETGSYHEGYTTYLQKSMAAAGDNGMPASFPLTLLERALYSNAVAGFLSYDIDLMNGEFGMSHQRSKSIEMAARIMILSFSQQESSQKEVQALGDHLKAASLKDMGYCSLDEQCLILKILLGLDDINAIITVFERICNAWWTGEWTITMCHTELYAILLFAQVFHQLSNRRIFESPGWNRETTDIRAPIMMTQMLSRVLSAQNANGAWGLNNRICLESTAFALQALDIMIKQPFLLSLHLGIRQSIERGRYALQQQAYSTKPLRSGNSLWLRYPAQVSHQLCEAHVLAALSDSRRAIHTNPRVDLPPDRALQKITALISFFHSNPNLANEPLFKIKAGAVESAFYVQKLKAMRNDIFPVTNAKEKDKYFDYIPIMWTMHNNIREARAPPVLIWDICVVSLYIFLVDEYMEGHVSQLSFKELGDLRVGIEKTFALDDFWPAKLRSNGSSPETHPLLVVSSPSDAEYEDGSRVYEALKVLSRWASHYLTYPSLLNASFMDLLGVRTEAKNYLLCHLQQIADNKRLTSQAGFSPTTPFGSPSMGYASWLHTIGSGHIGASLALTWFAACVGSKIHGPGQDCFRSTKQKLMLWNANSHSAKQLRMFNDFGSVVRDFEERNLNSTSFPDFFGSCDADWVEAACRGQGGVNGDARQSDAHALDQDFEIAQRKQILLDSAYYERKRTNEELDALYAELREEGAKGRRLADWLGLYLAGGDQFSDMYLLKDVTNSTK